MIVSGKWRKPPELAFDRSARTYTEDGHLKVARTPIAKVGVNPYYGREIPEHRELGLDPDRVYQLLRPADELEKAPATFNGVPLLIEHRPSMANDHPTHLTVGSIGTTPEWSATDRKLYNSLSIWEAEGIRGVEDEDRMELSPCYRYKAVMEPGEFEGVAYDGRMTDIRGNHVALVPEGRQGSDVMVADSLPREIMVKKRLHPRAVLVMGALSALLAPRMAQDQKIDLGPILKDYTPKTKTAIVVAAVEKATKGKLAQDASLSDLAGAIDAFKDDPETAEEHTVAADESGIEDIMAMCAGLPDEQKARVREALGKAFKGKETPEEEEAEETVTQAAMDAAIKAGQQAVEKRLRAEFGAIETAKREVRPVVGEIAVAMDSASAVYKFALDHLQVDLDGVPESAYPAVFRAEAKHRDARPRPAPLAQDAGMDDMFPGMSRIEVL